MAQVQMNVRIDSELKRAGDAAFEFAGISASDAVRSLWRFAARNNGDAQALYEEVDRLDRGEDERAAEKRRRLAALEEAPHLAERICAQYGLKWPKDYVEQLSYEELKEEAMLERMRERGLETWAD